MTSTLADLRVTLQKELRLEDRFASALFRTEELINELIRCPPQKISASLIEAYRQSRETISAADDILQEKVVNGRKYRHFLISFLNIKKQEN